MEIDTLLMGHPTEIEEVADALLQTGVDGLFTVEGPHDVFLPLVLAANRDLLLYTNVAIAFPRSPAHLAHTAWDLMELNDAGFALGLGTQVRAHIERRYGATWSHPAARMAEWIGAIRAFWDTWEHGTPLDFQGVHTQHTLSTPAFEPGRPYHDRPPIWLGALGPRMTEVALTVADGLLVHPFTSDRYLADTTLPRIEQTLSAAGRPRAEVTIVGEGIVACGRDATEQAAADEGARWLVGFYGSTPAYEPVLAAEGRADIHPELRRLSREGRWDEMARLVDDDLLDAVVLRGDPDRVAARVRDRFAGHVDRVGLYAPGGIADEALAAVVAGVRGGLPEPPPLPNSVE
ncbi:MAG TPA: TIGR03617 family F420-dependent LLM class oxidoreductase [Iamia sp.]|nr:TIGR03617 family F420-dependent LLM class oxidoreductase [Iamia sp.]